MIIKEKLDDDDCFKVAQVSGIVATPKKNYQLSNKIYLDFSQLLKV